MIMQTKNKPVDVVFFYPKTGVDFGATIAPPHAVMTIAAPLRLKGYNVKIIDQRVDPDWKEKFIEYLQQKPICVGISSMTGTQIYFALQAAKMVREYGGIDIPIVWGGTHPSSVPEQTCEHELVDVVAIGEGDVTFPLLVEAFATKRSIKDIKGIVYKDGGKVIKNPERELLEVEDLLPLPWDLVDVERYIHRDFYVKGVERSLDIGQTSRGCPFQCGFCSSAELRFRKWRMMSVDKALEHILTPVKKFNLDAIWIRDDEFYINRDRLFGIVQGIIDSGVNIKWYTSGTRINIFNKWTDEEVNMIKRSGANTLKFGAESGSNRMLRLMKKSLRWEETVEANLKAKRHDIVPAFALMIGFPTETFEDINQTIDLFVRLRRDNPNAQFEVIGTFTALPKTPLYDMALKYGLKPPDNLEGWISWLSDEYDVDGSKIPWFNEKDRRKIGNITYMSILANSSLNAIDGISSPTMRFMLKLLFSPISKFEKYKLINKWYSFSPELTMARFLRKKIFYKREESLH